MYTDKKFLPRRGEYVVATVNEIRDYGAYVFLDDYGISGFLPISEVSSRWIRKIDDVLKIGQKIVVKVLRIDKLTRSADVSLKDVSPGERERILREWKRNRRGKKLLEEVAKELNISYNDLMRKLADLASDYTNLYDLVLDIVSDAQLLSETDLTENEKEILLSHLTKKVRPKKYLLEITTEITCIGSGGVYKIIDALHNIENNIKKVSDINIEITHIAAPRYMIKLWSYNPMSIKKVKKILDNIISRIKDNVVLTIKSEVEKVEI